MPYAIELPFSLRGLSRPLPRHAIPSMHANFFQWLRAVDATWADQLHVPTTAPRQPILDEDGDELPAHGVEVKQPFTVSPIIHQAAHVAKIRITVLDDVLFEVLDAGLRKRPYVQLYDDTLELLDEHRVWHKTYARMAQAPNHSDTVTLAFDTPTCFRSGRLNHLLPDPARVFGHYLKQWNMFAPLHMHIDDQWLNWVLENIGISHLRLDSDVLHFAENARMQIGFIGTVTYKAIYRKADAQRSVARLLMWNCLADFAPYCGTGARTPQGMGQTRRL